MFWILPTVYGKSLIFQALPYFDNSTIMIMISPLNTIIEEQVRRSGGSAINFSDNEIKRIASVSTYKYVENDKVAVVPGDIYTLS